MQIRIDSNSNSYTFMPTQLLINTFQMNRDIDLAYYLERKKNEQSSLNKMEAIEIGSRVMITGH